MSEMVKEETPVLISYRDLVSFSDQTADEALRSDLIVKIGQAFGPDGLGLLGVEHVPDFQVKRERLLRLSHGLPYLPDIKECELPHTMYSTGWSHGREQLAPDKPDWAKGSFYANPWQDSLVEHLSQRDGQGGERAAAYWKSQAEKFPAFYADNVWPASMPQLREAFRDLGQCMMKVGGLLALVCDAYCATADQGGVQTNFYQTLTESRNSKGRLLHYFDMTQEGTSDDNDMWCGWHNDHGSLTCLAPGMFLDKNGNQVDSAKGAGLFVQSRSGEVIRVRMPSNVCGFQIGETSQIQSGGLLQATPHAVKAGTGIPGVTRQSFAVFLEPEFEAPLKIPTGKTLEDCQASTVRLPPSVRPLRERWRPGQTFGDFHTATVSAFAAD